MIDPVTLAAAAPEAHAPTATAANETTGATAATVTVLLRGSVAATGLCVPGGSENPSKFWGCLYFPPITDT